MKKILLFVLFAFLMQSASAQKEKCKCLGGLGILAGPLLSTIFDSESWETTGGFQTGLDIKAYQINKNASVYGGIGVSMQGAAYSEDYAYDYEFRSSLKSATQSDHEISGKVSLTYLIFPALLNYTGNNGFYGEIGLQPGLLIGAKDKIDGGDSSNFKDWVKTFDLGLPIGFGYKINEQTGVGARVVVGLTNIDNSESGNVNDHNLSFMALVRYNIGSFYTQKE